MSNALHTIVSTIRGGGSGANAWVAQITGPDPKYGLARAFVKKQSDTSRSGRSGSLHFEITDPGVYEYRNVQLPAAEKSIGNLVSGFVRVDASGGVEELSKQDVIDTVSPK